MLSVKRRKLFENEYEITENGLYVSTINTAIYSEATSLNLREKAYRINPEANSFYSFSLEEVDILSGRGPRVAKGTPHSVELQEKRYLLQNCAWYSPWFMLKVDILESYKSVGTIYKKNFFSSVYTIDISSEVPEVIQVFMFWLVTLYYRRDSGC